LKEVLLWVQCYQTASYATQKSLVKESIDATNFTVVFFKKLPWLPLTSSTITLISQYSSTASQDPPPAKRLGLAESVDDD